MSKKKKPVKSNDQNKELRLRFLERIEILCETFAGPGYFRKIPTYVLEHMFINRYPALKARAFPEATIPKSKVTQFHKLMNKFIGERYVELDNGDKLYLSWYLAEGLILINYVDQMAESDFPFAHEFKQAMKDYLPGSEIHGMIDEMLVELVHDTSVFLSDYNHTIITANIGATAFLDADSQTNNVLIEDAKPEKSSIIIDGEKRSITSLSWLAENQEWIHTMIRPSLLGFRTGSINLPIRVYIQQHALDKLKERIDITPGIMHFMVFLIMNQPEIKHFKNDNNSLVEYYLMDQKVGYLLVSLIDAKLIIRTFLFLTNDGTPEGKKLNQLLSLGKEDKKYLMIDTLQAFNSYHIDRNAGLSKIFREAGCGPLLKLGHLQEFSQTEIKDKDPESILKYLGDSENFQGLGDSAPDQEL